jgi:predicted nucleic acid-binding protein
MKDRFFLDTNIFVYSFDRNAPTKAVRAAKLIRRAIETRQGIVSYQVVQEFFNVALRRFAEPVSGAEAEQYLSTTFRTSVGGALFPGALQPSLTAGDYVLDPLVCLPDPDLRD